MNLVFKSQHETRKLPGVEFESVFLDTDADRLGLDWLNYLTGINTDFLKVILRIKTKRRNYPFLGRIVRSPYYVRRCGLLLTTE